MDTYPLDQDELLDRLRPLKRWLRKWGTSLGLLALTAITSAHTFGGYDCTNDCAPYAAGYNWALEHRVQTLTDCQPIQAADIKMGCYTYIGDPYRGSVQDDQGYDIDQ